jgi:hypothetical protein
MLTNEQSAISAAAAAAAFELLASHQSKKLRFALFVQQ